MADPRGPHQLSTDLSMCKHCGAPRPPAGFAAGIKCDSNVPARADTPVDTAFACAVGSPFVDFIALMCVCVLCTATAAAAGLVTPPKCCVALALALRQRAATTAASAKGSCAERACQSTLRPQRSSRKCYRVRADLLCAHAPVAVCCQRPGRAPKCWAQHCAVPDVGSRDGVFINIDVACILDHNKREVRDQRPELSE